jgi:hypothetical protein
VIDWRRVPWPLWAYCAVMLLGAVSIDVRASGPVFVMALIPIVMLAWLYFLLKGIRWLWFVTLGIYVLIIPEIVSGSVTWEGYASTVIGVTLLLLPATRHYFSSRAVGGSA